jgi:hypothetical protein
MRVMTIRVLACAMVIGLGSDTGVADQTRLALSSRPSGDMVIRPPRSIPRPGRADAASHPPLPRARPAPPDSAATATAASAPSRAGSNGTPGNHPTAAGFPPVVTLE